MERYKKIQEKKDFFIQFSDEEIEELGWEKNQKISITYDKDTNSITIKPFVSVEIDFSTYPRDVLELIIKESCDKDMSCNDVINDLLRESLKTTTSVKAEPTLLCENEN